MSGTAPELRVDVVIVGGGACGLTAALAARDAGAETLVLERYRSCEGSSAMSLGALCAAGSRAQSEHGVDDDAATFEADIMRKTGGAADAVLARVAAMQSGPALDWLGTAHAVPFGLDRAWRPAFGHTRQRMHTVPERSGAAMMARLQAAAEAAGAMILTDAEVTGLAADADRAIQAVRYRRPDGSEAEVGCGSVVLASCGFGGSRDMVSRYIPSMRDARYFGWDGNTGAAIEWGLELGAAVADMDAYQGLGLLAEPHGIDVNPKFLIEGGVQINGDGLRFSNELDDVSGQGARVIAQPGGVAWVVYDERIHAACRDLPQYVTLFGLGASILADDVAALARLTGMPPDTLAATLAEAASCAASGEADGFGRRFDRAPLAPPYRALKVTGALFHTQGGLVVDAQARVLTPAHAALPNLFAGGGAARSISGAGPSGYLPGAGLCMAITLGRIAGNAAAINAVRGSGRAPA